MEAASASFAKPSREELLLRCRTAAKSARSKGTPAKRPSAKQRKQAAAAVTTATAENATNEQAQEALLNTLRNEKLGVDQLKQLAEYEKDLFETCGGDAAAFCRMKGVQESAIPYIKEAIDSVKAGNPLPETLRKLMTNAKA